MSNPTGLPRGEQGEMGQGAVSGNNNNDSTTPEIDYDDYIGSPMWDNCGDTSEAAEAQDVNKGVTRMYFINTRGVKYEGDGGDSYTVRNDMMNGRIDILGVCETKLDSSRHEVRKAYRKCFREKYEFSKILMATSERQYGSIYKHGGVMMVTVGPTTGRVHKPLCGEDEYGRWCYTTYRGVEGRLLTVITAYQVGKDNPCRNVHAPATTARSTAAVTQQFGMMLERGYPEDMHPRTLFRKDLLAFIKDLQKQQCEIILAGDFNEELGEDRDGMSKIMHEAVLVDLMYLKMGRTDFATHEDGTKRIDYILASPRLATACIRAGYEPFHIRFKGDHRGMFLDFKTLILFGNETLTLASPAARSLRSKNQNHRQLYIRAKDKYLKEHNFYDRLQQLMADPTLDARKAEGLDEDWVRASLSAEKQCKRYPFCPYTKEIADKRRRRSYLNLLVIEHKKQRNYKKAREKALEKLNGMTPETIEDCYAELKTLNKEIPKLVKNAENRRKDELQANVETRLQAGDKAGAKAVRNIMIAEETAEMYRQLGALEGAEDRTIRRLEVPANGDYTNCKDCTAWRSIEVPAEIRAALLKRNQVHFGQANGTFPTVPPFSECVDWGASTYESDLILEGELGEVEGLDAEAIDELTGLLLKQFERTTQLDSIQDEITMKEWVGKMKVWNESTSTSPSGMHLGHHKSLIMPLPSPPAGDRQAGEEPPEDLESTRAAMLQCQLDLVNYAVRHKYSYKRWQKVVNVMLLKEPGNTKVHRLRVIHLYEADWNLILAVKWRQLIFHTINKKLLTEWQFGGLPGRDSLTPAFLEEMQWEITRASRRSLLRMDFDATSCYDRIIANVAGLAARGYGQHRTLVFIHGETLQAAKYHLKTELGISEESYSHDELSPIYGTGQGSGNSPAIWALISSRLFEAFETKANGATFVSPNRKRTTRVYIIGFVDDKNNPVNDFENPVQSPNVLLEKAQQDAQLWNDLLYRTGGALEVKKCQFHVAHYSFTVTGAPVLKPFEPGDDTKINVKESGAVDSTVSVSYLPATTPRRTLGCYKCPSGNVTKSLEVIKQNATKKADLIANSHLDWKSARRYYESVFWPSVSYTFPVSALPEPHMTTIQRKTSRQFLRKLGMARNTPNSVMFGPKKYGGLDFHTWYDAQGAGQLELIMKHWRTPSGVSDHLKIALSWAQRLSGFGTPILLQPSIKMPHLEVKYFSEFRKFLTMIGGSVEIDEDLAAPLQREEDFHLMERIVSSDWFSQKEIRELSYCMHYLQVQTLSDITTANGNKLDRGMMDGDPFVTSSTTRDIPIIQEKPESWKLWKQANMLWANYKGELTTRLGRWLHYSKNLRRNWPYHFDPDTSRLLVKTADGFTTHPPTAAPRTFKSIPTGSITILPSRARPVGCKESLHTIEMDPDKGVVLPAPSTPAPADFHTFEEYIQSLEPWVTTLLSNIVYELPLEEIVLLLLDGFLGGCDGSVKHQGTFGWVIALLDGRILVKAKGPAFGRLMDSYRAEAYGLLSKVLWIHHVLLYFGHTLTEPATLLYSDSESLLKKIKRIRQRTRPSFPNDCMEASWDVIQAIIRLLKEHDTLMLKHVTGHQDDDTPFEELPLPAKLNVMADRLAGEFQEESNHGHLPVPMIEGVGIQFMIDGETITSRHRNTARSVRKTAALRRSIRDRIQVTDEVFDTIDWDAHCAAASTFKGPSVFLIKFLHNLLPVGKRVNRYDSVRYLSGCPSCDEQEEDLNHVFTCRNEKRAEWVKGLRQSVRRVCDSSTTGLGLIELLLDGLYCWHNDTAVREADHPASLHPLIRSQDAIGWGQLLFGRFSTLWQARQTAHLNGSNIEKTNRNCGSTWLSNIIKVIWHKCHEEWEVRNKARHGDDDESKKEKKQAEIRRRLEYLYSMKQYCFPTMQNKWFYESVDVHIQREHRISQQKDWLAYHSPLIMQCVRTQATHRALHQQIMDRYLTVQQPAPREGVG